MILIKAVENIFERHLRYLSFPFSIITEIKLLYQESNLELAIAELRTLLERFANNKLMDLVIDAINALIDDTRRDESLREWFKSIDAYIRKVFLALRYHIFALIRYLK